MIFPDHVVDGRKPLAVADQGGGEASDPVVHAAPWRTLSACSAGTPAGELLIPPQQLIPPLSMESVPRPRIPPDTPDAESLPEPNRAPRREVRFRPATRIPPR